MPASDTDIANRALRLLKAGRITDIDAQEKNANVLRDIYDEVRAEILRAHTWKFATKFKILGRLSTSPAMRWDHAYALPSDWVRTISLHDNDAGTGNVAFEEAEIEDVGALFCSIETAYLSYVYEVTDPNRLSPGFRTAFAFALAVQAPGIANIGAVALASLNTEARKKLNRAKSTDSLGSPPRKRPAGSWATSRQSWPSSRWPR